MPYTQERKEKYKIISVELSNDSYEKLKQNCKQSNMKVSEYVRKALADSYK